jgi:membrane-associated phospholipid phosphatase
MDAKNRNTLGKLYDRTLGKALDSSHAWALLALVILDVFVYFITNLILSGVSRGTLALPLDGRIPLIPAFITVYFGSYLFWLWGFIVATRQSHGEFFAFFVRVGVSLLVTLCFFCLLPLEIARPEITGEGLFSDAMRLLYRIDPPHNLFPSLHCFFSWILYVQVRGKKEYPLLLRLSYLLISVAVFFSTLFTRQHYLLDVVGGVALAELSGLLLLTPLPRLAERFFLWLDRLLFSKRETKKEPDLGSFS